MNESPPGVFYRNLLYFCFPLSHEGRIPLEQLKKFILQFLILLTVELLDPHFVTQHPVHYCDKGELH
jgi:hypothetical protein